MEENKIYSFPPIASPESTTLILGSMPGEESLRKQQYYAHPRNLFWEFLGSIFKFDKDLDYEIKIKLLLMNGVAVWDTLRGCERKGSLDSKIVQNSEEANDFEWFFSSYPKISRILFNGKKASACFEKHILKKNKLASEGFSIFQLPSTSPANASIPKPEKLLRWEKALRI